MEILLKGSEKELNRFIKSQRLHLKRKGIIVLREEDRVEPMTDEEIQVQQDLFDSRLDELNKYPEFNHKLKLDSNESDYALIIEKLEDWKVKKQLFDERMIELNKFPEFGHKLGLNTAEKGYNKIIENLDKWKTKNNV